MESLAERLSYKRAGGSKDHHKEHRLSKAHIGQPMKIERNENISEIHDNSDGTVPSMMMKCVVVQSDDKGYGLTVSGDKPVYIQSVKEDGAAAKAGVSEGDRILKVNGSKATDLNHVEVVRLIKANMYVVLTLLGAPPASAGTTSSNETSSSSNHQNPSGHGVAPPVPKHVFYDEKVETIKKMLEQETAEFERIKEEYGRNPEPKILKQLGSAQKLKQDLEKQLWKAESTRAKNEEKSQATTEGSVADTDGVFNFFKSAEPAEDQVTLIDMDYIDPAEAVERTSNIEGIRNRRSQTVNEPSLGSRTETTSENSSSAIGLGEDITTMELLNEFQPNNLFKYSEDVKIPNQQQNTQIMNFEDDDIVADNDTFQDHGPFNDLEKLRQRPAHLAVFLNYVLASHNPANFLLSVSVDGYKQLSSSKDMVKQGDAIYRIYLASNAPFRVAVDEGITRSIQSALSAKNPSEDTLRGIFDPAVQVANSEIRNQLSLYRMKREQGLGSLFGDEKLQHAINLDQQSDIRIVDEIIMPTLADLQQTTGADELEQTRINIKQEALQSFLNQYGTKRAKAKTSRIYSILRPSKPQQLNRASKGLGSVDSIVEEQNSKKTGGIGGIFTGKARRRYDSNAAEKLKSHHDRGFSSSKRDKKNMFWETPPNLQGALLKPVKVGPSASLDHTVAAGSMNVGEGVMHPSHLKRSERSSEPIIQQGASDKEAPSARPKSMPPDDGQALETNSASIQPPQIFESGLPDSDSGGNLFMANQENEIAGDTNDTLSVDKKSKPTRVGSFRRRRDDDKRHSNSHQSHSDPDKATIEQVVSQHNSSGDQSEQTNRHHTMSLTDSTLSLSADERKYIELLPNFAEDDEISIDAAQQHWPENVPKKAIADLNKKETKRQQIIHELIHTEQHHVRDLKILEKAFYEPLAAENLMSSDELNQAFPNLKGMLNLHRDLNKALLKQKEHDGHVVKEIGDILLERFDGDGGNTFKEECAMYCGNQSTVLSLIKEKVKKDQKFNQFLQIVQRQPVCRKLHLKDFVPMEFQRLTKYPLLLENIIKHTNKKQEAEIEKVKKACARCRDFLAFVNQAVKEAEDRQKIIEIQQNLDREPVLKWKHPTSVTQEFKHIDLTERPSVLQGPLTFRIGQMDKRKELALHCILYDDVLVLLQKQDDRYVLKCYGTQGDKSSGGSHAPFLSTHNLLIRNVATDKRAFFVMSTSDTGPQMYEFAASSIGVKKQWMDLINETAKKKVQESSVPSSIRRKAIAIHNSARSMNDAKLDDEESGKQIPAGLVVGRGDDNHPIDLPVASPIADEFDPPSGTTSYPDTNNMLLDKIQTAHQEISEALAAKCKYLAEMSGLDEQEMETVLDMSTVDPDPEPNTLIKHSILCVDKLTVLLNDCAIPESTFPKGDAELPPGQSGSNRLSSELSETGYQSDNGTIIPPEKWAVPVTHSHQSTSSDVPSSPNEETAATLNSVSDLPLSESETTLSEGEMSPTKRKGDEDGAAETSEGEQFFDTVEPEQPTEDAADQPTNPSKNRDPVAASLTTNNLMVPEDNASEASRSRPQSGVDLCARAGIVPINRMMNIVLSLQTQLTQLMHVANESESDRQRLREENEQLRDELRKMENDHPPAYEAVPPQDDNYANTIMTSSDAGMTSLARDVAFIRASHRSCPDDIQESDDIAVDPLTYRRTARRSTGF